MLLGTLHSVFVAKVNYDNQDSSQVENRICYGVSRSTMVGALVQM